MKQLSLSDDKRDFGIPEIDILGPEIIKNELWVTLGVPEGSQTRISKSVSYNFDAFEVILGDQNEPESIQNRC